MDNLYKKPKKEIYTLSGVIKCSLCGEKFSSYINGGHRYYRCQGYTKKRKCPSKSKSINASLIEGIVFKKMMERCRNINFSAFMVKFREKMNNFLPELQQYVNSVAENKEKLNTIELYGEFYEIKKKAVEIADFLGEYQRINASFGYDNLAMHLEEFDAKDLKKFYKEEISIDFDVKKGTGVINFIFRDEEPIKFSLKLIPQITSEKTTSLKE